MIFLLASPVVIGVVAGFKLLVSILLKKLEVKNVVKVNLLIGLGVISFLGIILPVLLLFVTIKGFEFYFYAACLYNLTSAVISLLFFTDINLPESLLCERNKKLISTSACFQVFLFFVTVTICLYYKGDQGFAALAHTAFGPIFGISATEFSIVAGGGLKGPSRVVAVDPPIPKKEHDPRIECEVCLLEYSETIRIPRILKKCGHTICEKCADTLLKKNNGKFLLCPFCQTMTIVNGPVLGLSKNHAVIDIVKGLKD